MTPQEYKTTIRKLGLSQLAAAEFLGIGPRTSRRWIAGRSRIPHAVELLFDLMIVCNIRPADLQDSQNNAQKAPLSTPRSVPVVD
jgi:transcriptional regulator with XRE-family HTH domain